MRGMQLTLWRHSLKRQPWLSWIGRHELASLVSLVLVALSIWGFVELADEVIEGDTTAYDERIVLAMRNPDDLSDPIGPVWFEEMVRDVTALGGTIVLVGLTLAAAAYLSIERKWRVMLFMLVAVFGGLAAGQLLKLGFDRARPELVPHHSQVYTASFPSGHAMGAAVVYMTLAALLARVAARRESRAFLLLLGVLLTVLVGASRVYLGVHWPTDVLAGWTAGAAWALMCWAAARMLQRRGKVEQEGPEDEEPDEPRSGPDPGIGAGRIHPTR